MEYQPKIVMIDKPVITDLSFPRTEVPINIFDFIAQDSNSGIPTYDLNVQVSINLRLQCVNSGNSLANIVGIVYSDTTSDLDFLRDKFLDKKFKGFQTNLFPPFSKNEVLADNTDTARFDFSMDINMIANQLFTLHFLLFYKNSLGNYYDTYYCSQYKLEELLFPSPFAIVDNKIIATNQYWKVALGDMYSFVNSKSTYKIYCDEKEAEYIEERIRSLQQEQSKD